MFRLEHIVIMFQSEHIVTMFRLEHLTASELDWSRELGEFATVYHFIV
jgi:hypothetical protein